MEKGSTYFVEFLDLLCFTIFSASVCVRKIKDLFSVVWTLLCYVRAGMATTILRMLNIFTRIAEKKWQKDVIQSSSVCPWQPWDPEVYTSSLQITTSLRHRSICKPCLLMWAWKISRKHNWTPRMAHVIQPQSGVIGQPRALPDAKCSAASWEISQLSAKNIVLVVTPRDTAVLSGRCYITNMLLKRRHTKQNTNSKRIRCRKILNNY